MRRLGALLRAAVVAPEPDWTGFWPGVVRGIEAAKRPVAAPRRSALRRHGWAFGSAAVAAALLASLTVWQLVPGRQRPAEAHVVVQSADSPGRSVMVYSMPEQDMTVVWVFGLD